MTDSSQLDAALDRVVETARAHLAAVRAAAGRAEDESVWQAYVALNNASCEYDDLLLEAYGEVTPWDVGQIDPARAQRRADADDGAAPDPYQRVISVRQRRDYQVPSVSALIRAAEQAREEADDDLDEVASPIETVSQAVLELLQAGDGSLGALDISELEPLDGLVTIVEAERPLDPDAFDEADGGGPFLLGAADTLVGRLDEHPYADLDDLDDVPSDKGNPDTDGAVGRDES